VLTSSVHWQLLLPPVVFAIALVVYIYAFHSQEAISERHSSIGMLILLFVVASLSAAIVIGALRRVLPTLIEDPNSRSAGIVLFTSAGVAFLALLVLLIIWYV
jgi:hypothetical protein